MGHMTTRGVGDPALPYQNTCREGRALYFADLTPTSAHDSVLSACLSYFRVLINVT